MKKKLFLLLTMIFAITFGINNVSAEETIEYKAGDLVEVINPDGGESLKFYIEPFEDEEGEYILFSVDPIIKNETVNESEEKYESDKELFEQNNRFKYLYDIDENIENNNYSFIQEITSAPISCIDEIWYSSYDNIKDSYYFNCSRYKGKYNNSFILSLEHVDLSKNKWRVFSYLEISDDPKYDFVLRNIKTKEEAIEEFNTKKLDYYLALQISEPNLKLIRKAEIKENNEQSANNNVQTTTKDEVTNPKTSDTNPYIIIGFTLVGVAAIIISRKKIIKLK